MTGGPRPAEATENYGDAARCYTCAGRACLPRRSVDRLVDRSDGRLQAFRCPERRGWHVWAPGIESREFAGR